MTTLLANRILSLVLQASIFIYANSSVLAMENSQTQETLSPALAAKIEKLFPRILAWYEQVESDLWPSGRALSSEEAAVALTLGVRDPGRVRIVVSDKFPMPADEELNIEAQRYGLGTAEESGRCNGYIIMLKPRVAENLSVVIHELVHVRQQEQMGRAEFLKRYIFEMEIMGYDQSPLENEARVEQARVR